MNILSICENSDVLKVIYFIKIIINIVKTIIPIALIILVTFDCAKGVISGSEKVENILKVNKNRLLSAILIFTMPTIISIVLEVIDEETSYESCWVNANSTDIDKYHKLEENGDGDEENKNSPISQISNNGVIVSIKTSTNEKISGYYFSYTKERPNKNTGGYIATDKKELDVARLAGTTYVWVEYASGEISGYKTITLPESVLLYDTKKGGYTVLNTGYSLRQYLASKKWSIEELNALIARSVRAVGLNNKEGAATAAATVVIVLAQEYKIKIPYWMGGKQNNYGALPSWGMVVENKTYDGYKYYGPDCDGFVNWSYSNAGLRGVNSNYYLKPEIRKTFDERTGEIGDVIRREPTNGVGHVSIIIGKSKDGFIIAEAYGKGQGVVISTHKYTDSKGYTILKGEDIVKMYTKGTSAEYPKAFLS